MLLQRQTALARRLATDGETSLSLTQTIAALAAPQAAETADETGAPGTAKLQSAADAQNTHAPDTDEAQHAQMLLEAFSALSGQTMQIASLRQETIEYELRRTRESQSVLLTARTPQNAPGGLTGAYEQTLSVAGPAAAPTQQSMEEISRYFERDARRYG